MADDGLHPGDLLAGRYRLIDRIGSGGMAVIWRAHDETLERLVAVKVLDLSLSGDSRMRDLVRREAWAAARLNHPDVAGVYDFVLVGEIGVLVMQLIEGDPLADLVARGRLPWREAVRIGLRIAKVLEQAHGRGVIHRDITPDNVVVHGDRVTVLDFGIAAKVGEPDDDSTGASFGTPAYVAPERLDGTPAQPATDVYALGVVMFEMLTGRVPFKVSGWDDVAADHGEPPAPRVPGAPASLSPLVARMLARDPASRPTAAQVVGALQQRHRSRSIAALAGAGAVVATVALIVWWPTDGERELPAHPATATPGPSPAAVASVTPAPEATAAPAPVPERPLTAGQARQALLDLIDQAEAEGGIRQDVALDLRQVVRNTAGVSGVDNVRRKIADREREGLLSAQMAERLRAAAQVLAEALARV